MINTAAAYSFTVQKRVDFYTYYVAIPIIVGHAPGGKIEKDEALFEGLERECQEEIGYFPKDAKLIPIQKFVNNTFTYHTFFCAIDDEFVPILNDEHIGYAWVGENQHPKPLHPGLFSTMNIDIVRQKLETLTENKNGV